MANPGLMALESVRKALRLTERFAFGKPGSLLHGYTLSISPPDLASPAAEALKSVRELLRHSWREGVPINRQGILSLHKSGGKTVIQLGSSEYGSLYITLPISLAPDSLMGQLLTKISRSLTRVFGPGSIVALYDGDFHRINPKYVLRDQILIRSVKDDASAFLEATDRILAAEPPSPMNSTLHVGVPSNEDELRATFHGGDWDLWRNVYGNWQRRATRQGFSLEPGGNRDAILQSLSVKKNVIIVAAHARDRVLYLPAPLPDGSQIKPEDLEMQKAAITANKPVVYLFCCETAEISELHGFVDTLLSCGAAAVIAPQTEINADKSAQLFEQIVTSSSNPATALERLLQAEQTTKYREMEVFVA
jgi:hypothetical protein